MKDHATFFAAAELLVRARPDIRFVVVGKGSEGLAVPATIKSNVHLVKERRDVARLLRGLDVLVLSSAFGEGFPNVVCEAMASAVPCVVTDVGDSADLVGDTGRVVSPRDPVALAAAVDDVLSLPPETMTELGREARERVRENWSIERAANRYRAVWDELMSDSYAS
jgi:glycosyltransferase involved in cell wall biosynthesis